MSFGRAAAEPELGHDGLKELKISDSNASRGGGGFRGGCRGSSAICSSPPDSTHPLSQPQTPPVWTEHTDSSLYADFYQSHDQSVRAKLLYKERLTFSGPHSNSSATPPAPRSDYSEKVLVVNIPKPIVKEEMDEENEEEPSFEDVFIGRPCLVSSKLPEYSHHPSVSATLSPIIAQKLQLPQMHAKFSSARSIQAAEAVLPHPTGTLPDDRSQSQPVFFLSRLHPPSYNAGSLCYGFP
ncbi:hypothetical protein BDP27DRAFT_312998 [Rhodocollybia butyracea]|uniref:Uncharacterized protein n=1 Tax=Rhodocollybia butyracea TaxID=206335 RepID=A0A9P5U102_9AGAR|nr:hypothetical protein BDP27DRAFT_312998 [Rhodocollybia butyracea]